MDTSTLFRVIKIAHLGYILLIVDIEIDSNVCFISLGRQRQEPKAIILRGVTGLDQLFALYFTPTQCGELSTRAG